MDQANCGQRINPKFHQYTHSFGIFSQASRCNPGQDLAIILYKSLPSFYQSFKMTIVIFSAKAMKCLSVTWSHPVMTVKVWTGESQQSRFHSASSLLLGKYVLKTQTNKQTNQQKNLSRFMRSHDPDWRVTTPLSETDIRACVCGGSCHTRVPLPGLQAGRMLASSF